MMQKNLHTAPKLLAVLLAGLFAGSALFSGATLAGVYVQCPGDLNGDADRLDAGEVIPAAHPQSVCKHLTAGDGFVRMADDPGKVLYTFGFHDVTGILPAGPQGDGAGGVMESGMLAAEFAAPTIALKQGDEFYLTLTNVGMVMRPDLFDPHSVHFHGFPQAAPVFDGMPEGSIAVNMGSSLTYYYNIVEPGTFMYHCHVEATEHMQMGMLGNLYVSPVQNGQSFEYPPGSGKLYSKFVYNDGDGSTGFDVELPLQLGSFDPAFHDQSVGVQPLPFALMKDTYSMLNGRGYPDTVNPATLTPPAENGGKVSQRLSSLVTATAGQKVLLRLSNLSVTNFYTVTALGLPMKVVGTGAAILRGPDPDGAGALKGRDLYYDTASVTLGGGESADVIVDTAGISAGTYFLYTTNLNYLSNNTEDYGGMMTEIVIQ